MPKFFAPADDPADWQRLLAKPDLHWKTGYSARSMAHSWTDARGFPSEIRAIFEASGVSCLRDLKFLIGIPEHEVPLPGGRAPSQNDVFVLAKGSDGLVSISVEGKVAEAFDSPVDKRFAKPSPGQTTRLEFLLELLELRREDVGGIGYQLLHRTASALLEAQRFGARHAVMLVHSFSPELAHFDDYAAFVQLYGDTAEPGRLVTAKQLGDITLYLGWVVGNPEYLAR
jgi:hypothetical protein